MILYESISINQFSNLPLIFNLSFSRGEPSSCCFPVAHNLPLVPVKRPRHRLASSCEDYFWNWPPVAFVLICTSPYRVRESSFNSMASPGQDVLAGFRVWSNDLFPAWSRCWWASYDQHSFRDPLSLQRGGQLSTNTVVSLYRRPVQTEIQT